MVFIVGNMPDHTYYLHGDTRERGNVLVVDNKGYLGPICDGNWGIEEVNFF